MKEELNEEAREEGRNEGGRECLLIFLPEKSFVTPLQRPVLARSRHGTKIT